MESYFTEKHRWGFNMQLHGESCHKYLYVSSLKKQGIPCMILLMNIRMINAAVVFEFHAAEWLSNFMCAFNALYDANKYNCTLHNLWQMQYQNIMPPPSRHTDLESGLEKLGLFRVPFFIVIYLIWIADPLASVSITGIAQIVLMKGTVVSQM